MNKKKAAIISVVIICFIAVVIFFGYKYLGDNNSVTNETDTELEESDSDGTVILTVEDKINTDTKHFNVQIRNETASTVGIASVLALEEFRDGKWVLSSIENTRTQTTVMPTIEPKSFAVEEFSISNNTLFSAGQYRVKIVLYPNYTTYYSEPFIVQ